MKLTILLIIPNLGQGGAQTVFRDQLVYYSKHHNVISCVFNWDDSFQEDRNSSIISLDVPAGRNILTKVYFFWKRISRLKRIKEQFRVDIAISHLEGADYINILSRKREKVITWMHGTKQFDKNISGILGILRRKIFIPLVYRYSDRVITVSQGIKEELIHYFNLLQDKIITVNNGISTADILVYAEKEISNDFIKLSNNYPILITHCRLAKQKNLTALLQIMVSLPRDSNLKLIILGDGELRDALLTQCSLLNLRYFSTWNDDQWTENFDIYFLGYQSNPYPYLKHASLYLMTSLWEGFPLSLCEALACGLPILAADCYTGPREILCPELPHGQPVLTPYISRYGVLMPIPNSNSQIDIWAETIITIIGDEELRSVLSTSAVKGVIDFDKSKVEDQWLKILSI